MGIRLSREKRRNLLLSFFYKLNRLPWGGKRFRFKVFLNLAWIFGRFAHEYSFKNYEFDEHPIRVFTKTYLLNHIKYNHSVLDLGCKYGEISYFISEKARKVIGIDFDENAINVAKKKFQRENLEFVTGDALQFLNNIENQFDVLILSHILEHLDDPFDFLNKFKSHFKFIYIELPDFDKSYHNLYRQDLNLDLIYTDVDHINEFDRIELIQMINDSGLTIIESEFRFGFQKYWCKV